MNISTDYNITEGELKDKVILVTGANRGFGRAMTFDLSKAGATVIMLGRDLASLETTYVMKWLMQAIKSRYFIRLI